MQQCGAKQILRRPLWAWSIKKARATELFNNRECFVWKVKLIYEKHLQETRKGTTDRKFIFIRVEEIIQIIYWHSQVGLMY